MSQRVRIVTCYVCRRKRRCPVPHEAKVTDELWLVVEIGPEQDADAVPKWVLNPVLDADAANDLGERLKEALAESAADRIVEMVWKIGDGLSDKQIADLVASLPDSVKTLVQEQLDGLAQVAGVPAPVASLGADVTATLMLSSVLRPVENDLHTLEVVGIVIGLVTGLHPLAIICAKHLAHDELGSMLATAIEQAMSSPSTQKLDGVPSVADRSATEPQSHVETLPTVSGVQGHTDMASLIDTAPPSAVAPSAVQMLEEAVSEALNPAIDRSATAINDGISSLG